MPALPPVPQELASNDCRTCIPAAGPGMEDSAMREHAPPRRSKRLQGMEREQARKKQRELEQEQEEALPKAVQVYRREGYSCKAHSCMKRTC